MSCQKYLKGDIIYNVIITTLELNKLYGVLQLAQKIISVRDMTGVQN